jgi:Flp pilus assembly protein TadD
MKRLTENKMRKSLRHVLSAAALLALAACGGGATPPKPGEQSSRMLALDAEQHGDWIGAVRYWEREAAASPKDRTVTIALVRALRHTNACGRAAPYIEQLAQSKDASALIEAGKCHLVSGRFTVAATVLEAAAKADPKSWEAETVLAVALDYQQHHEEALAHHNRAALLAPKNPVVLSNKALSVALAGHLPQAVALMQAAAAMPGASARVRMNLALLEAVSGNGDIAAMMSRQEGDADADTAKLLQRIADEANQNRSAIQ